MNERRVTPLKAIRLKCLDCCLGQAHEVRLCPVKDCTLYRYRFGRKPKARSDDKLTPLRVIRGKCLDCSACAPSRVRECPILDCVLYQYRMGRNPNRAGMGRKGGNPYLSSTSRNQDNADVPDQEDESEIAA